MIDDNGNALPFPQGALERLLQRAADGLWIGLPDRPIVKIAEQGIHWSFTGWSAALFRHEVRGQSNAETVIGWACRLNPGAKCSTIALSAIRICLGKAIDHQHDRHVAAQALNLVVDGMCSDMGPEQLRIDRSLLRLLEQSGMNVQDIARQFYAPDARQAMIHDANVVCLNWERLCTVEHEGTGPPIISTWTSVRSGEFDGTRLEIPYCLPETILADAPGRRLGEIIETGVAQLDARRIEAARGREQGRSGFWHETTNTEFRLEPDWVQLG